MVDLASLGTAGRLSGRKETPALTALIVAGAAIVTALVVSRGLGNLIAETQPEVVLSLGLNSPDALCGWPRSNWTLNPTRMRIARRRAGRRAAKARSRGSLEYSLTGAEGATFQRPDASHAWADCRSAHRRRIVRSLLMNASVKRSIRDPLANIWLANFDLGRKDYAGALERIDALLRTSPNMSSAAFPVLIGIASTPEANDALAAVLARDPPWRAGFLNYLPARVGQAVNVDDLYLKLMSMRPPLPNDELKPYLDALIGQNAIEQAYYLWMKTLPPDRVGNLGYLFNGDFQAQSSGLPFDWVMDPIQGAKAEIKNYPQDDQRRALSVEFGSGGRVPFKNVTQMTLIPPGHYRLSGEYRANQLTNSRGMTWRLYCAESGSLVAETPRVSGTTDSWDPFDVSFDIPDQNCRAQWLRLELAYRVDLEQEVAGSIWYDNLKIENVAPGTVEAPTDPLQAANQDAHRGVEFRTGDPETAVTPVSLQATPHKPRTWRRRFYLG